MAIRRGGPKPYWDEPGVVVTVYLPGPVVKMAKAHANSEQISFSELTRRIFDRFFLPCNLNDTKGEVLPTNSVARDPDSVNYPMAEDRKYANVLTDAQCPYKCDRGCADAQEEGDE